jgi:hypothetical protein
MPTDAPDPEPDSYRVDPAKHRGRDDGILSRLFRLTGQRRDDDHRGPRPLPRTERSET